MFAVGIRKGNIEYVSKPFYVSADPLVIRVIGGEFLLTSTMELPLDPCNHTC